MLIARRVPGLYLEVLDRLSAGCVDHVNLDAAGLLQHEPQVTLSEAQGPGIVERRITVLPQRQPHVGATVLRPADGEVSAHVRDGPGEAALAVLGCQLDACQRLALFVDDDARQRLVRRQRGDDDLVVLHGQAGRHGDVGAAGDRAAAKLEGPGVGVEADGRGAVFEQDRRADP
jgi:hypothetical protein